MVKDRACAASGGRGSSSAHHESLPSATASIVKEMEALGLVHIVNG